ncbi:MAG TPA: SIR2 family protein [Tepidisphaeraceae bacterium]|jgi:hypothetical protein|nr:SIR2 family protein [Tepidisphaeraceae bacterium]
MTIDPGIALALAVHAHKGVYALLLGSGVSRAAGIPTGYEVTTALIKRVATAAGEDPGTNPDAWYESKFGRVASYSKLIEEIASTPPERMSLLRGFFEPTTDEREQGLKLPTRAHKSIAKLVAAGYINVIITTNFDRLLEDALNAEGVNPYVVSAPDQIAGMMPLTHINTCLIVKIHGDYLDTRIKNTPDELAGYDIDSNALLDRIFSEYGLIVCGWSCDWDPALCAAVTRNTRFRFGTFWMSRGSLTATAEGVAKFRFATINKIDSADQAFGDLEARVSALSEERIADPVSPQIALALTKRFMSEDKHFIQLEDLVVRELNSVRDQCAPNFFPMSEVPTHSSFVGRVGRMETVCAKIIPMVAALAYWGSNRNDALIARCVSSLARQESFSGAIYDYWDRLRLYPANLTCYAACVSACIRQRFGLLKLLLVDSTIRQPLEEAKPLIQCIAPGRALHYEAAQWLDPVPNGGNRKTPGSDWICKQLQPMLGNVFGADVDFEDAFDKFEMLLMLISSDICGWAPIGRFSWRNARSAGGSTYQNLITEVRGLSEAHLVLASGLFGGKLDRFNAAVEKMTEGVSRAAWG